MGSNVSSSCSPSSLSAACKENDQPTNLSPNHFQDLPIDKLDLSCCHSHSSDGLPLKLAAIYYNGNFSPVHSGHIEAMRHSIATLREAGYTVIAAYISPTSP